MSDEVTKVLHLSLQCLMVLGAIASPVMASGLKPIGTYSTGIYDDAAANIPTYDPVTQNLFVNNKATNQIDVLNITNPATPFLQQSITIENINSDLGTVNSVAFGNGMLAAAVENKNAQAPGKVLFFNANGEFLNSVNVGALPDMLTFIPNGNKLLVANEGEPSDDYLIDPEGSVSIIDLANGVTGLTQNNVTNVGFEGISLVGDVRIFGPNATVAQDLEPEYITVAENGEKAWVTLQENNAIAILDLVDNEFEKVVGLGFKDHSLKGNGLDASDEDETIKITTYDNLFGMYQPDEVASYNVDGQTYLVTANEGSGREFEFEDANGETQTAFNEETRVEDLNLDPTAFPDAENLQKKEVLGRLTVTNTMGDIDGDGDFDRLFAFGGRSFSIWDEDGNLIWDSGDDLEQIVARQFPDFFNSNNDENNFDDRSDDKGPEPEGVTLGKVGDRIIAFIGSERVGGVFSYDVTDPFNPLFLDYTNNRDFSVDFDLNEEGDPDPTAEQLAAVGDLGAEGLLFISPEDSPNNRPLLVVSNEVSGTTTIFAVETVPEPSSILGLLGLTFLGWLSRKKRLTANS
ncbi:MAG: choice-of-anchor I family protein [Xenococcaceae cyanobacterium MO_188.B32]|nr:choice-of-anchor I family protein [Xenococcaceae cyanobacterium MO_188.B32]